MVPALAVLLSASAAFAAPDEAECRRLKEEKLASPFLQAAPWQLDYDRARQEAAESGRVIFAYFTASSFH